MSHPIPAIVESVVDLKSIERQVQKAKIALDDADRLVDATGKSHESAVEQQRRARVEIGRQLIEARQAYGRGEWLPFLERCGIDRRRASEYMTLAGYVDEKCPTQENVGHSQTPTLHDAGIDRRPRKSEREEQPDPPKAMPRQSADNNEDRTVVQLPRVNDLDRALMNIHKTMMGYAQTWPRRSRIELAKMLRGLASEIESMRGDEE